MDPFFAIPGMLVFTIAGWIIAFKIITAPLRGARHIYKVFSKKTDIDEKENSKDVIADASRRIGAYFAFLFATILGIGLLGVLSWANIPAGFTVVATILVGGVLWILYIELQNRI
jgi:hypothetical protein